MGSLTPNMGDLVQWKHPQKLGWNGGELELNYRGYMWVDLIFISFRPLHWPTCVQWATGRLPVVMVHVGLINIGDTDNICDILSP